MARPIKYCANSSAIKEYLELDGFSYRQFAERAGISKSTVGNLVNPSYEDGFNKETALKVSNALRQPWRVLFLPTVLHAENSRQHSAKVAA